MVPTRSSVRPARSSAAIVFSKVGGAGSAAMRVDLGELLGHRGLERRLELLDLDLVERRHAAVGAGPGGEQRVVGGGRGGGEQRRHAEGRGWRAEALDMSGDSMGSWGESGQRTGRRRERPARKLDSIRSSGSLPRAPPRRSVPPCPRRPQTGVESSAQRAIERPRLTPPHAAPNGTTSVQPTAREDRTTPASRSSSPASRWDTRSGSIPSQAATRRRAPRTARRAPPARGLLQSEPRTLPATPAAR